MSNENQHIISEKQFELLLNHALLAREQSFNINEKTTETMAQHILHTTEIPVAENQSVVAKLMADFTGGTKFWLNAFLLLFLLGGSLAVVISFNKHPANNHSPESALIPVVAKEEKNNPEPIPSIAAQEITVNPLPVINPSILALIDSSDEKEIAQIINGNRGKFVPTTLHIPEPKSLAYEEIPTLTEAVKKQTAKDKLKMLRDIANPKKKVYSIVPMGKTPINGVMTTIQAFYIKNSEVTNFEYRTFLNDLLVQGQYDNYLLAKPVSGGWKAAGIPAFEDKYFDNPAYNDFPVVNITRNAAILYCAWLTNEVSNALKNKEIKWSGFSNSEKLVTDFRIPTSQEWIYAARGGDSTALKYPWGRYVPDSVQNARGCFLCNFNYDASKDYFKGKAICPGFGKLKQGGYHQPVITTAGMAIDTLLTAPVYSYNPNKTGQYCMMGNVSEMVTVYDFSTHLFSPVRAMGGNWNSPVSDILIESPEQYVGVEAASPYIGFRPVMTFLGKK